MVIYKLGNSEVRTEYYGGKSGIQFVSLHEDERTAVSATKKVIDQYGGRLIMLRQNGLRNISFTLDKMIYEFDPNRIFSDEGIRKTLLEHANPDEKAFRIVRKFARELVKELIGNKKIVAVHNNSGDDYSILSYLYGGPHFSDVKKLDGRLSGGYGDFLLTTDESIFERLKSKEFNIILQDNKKAKDDGSLSVYCGRKGISYINIEAKHGNLEKQVEMLEAVVGLDD